MTHRIMHLDGLRGILASTVVISHIALLGLQKGKHPEQLQEMLYWLGPTAVDVFFVLSGFVLALPWTEKPIPYLTFLGRRILRLYPAHLTALLLVLLLKTLPPLHHQNLTLQAQFLTPPTLDQLLSALTLLPFAPAAELWPNTLNPVLWSLVVEMVGALLVPPLLRLLPLLPRTVQGLAVSGTLVLLLMGHTLWVEMGSLTAILMGAWLARCWKTPAPSWSLLFAPLLLLHRLYIGGTTGLNTFVGGLGAMWLLHHLLHAPQVQRVLLATPLLYLGRISYSLYLLHLPVMVCLTLFVPWPPVLTGLLSLPVVVLLADVLHRLVERPAQRQPTSRGLKGILEK